MKRVSVTTLEKFRRYMDGVSSYDSEESLIDSLKGLFKGNDKTDFGGAYHQVIEGNCENFSGNIYVKDRNGKEYVFTPAQAAPALIYKRNHPAMVHEMNLHQVYETVYGPLQVTARIDGIEGIIVRDIKTRFKSLQNDEDYRHSIQWKLYLDMLGLNTFYFDVFEVKNFDALPSKKPFIMPAVEIVAHDPIECMIYEYMHDEIITLLNDFLQYLNNRNISSLLKNAINETEDFIF